MPGLTASITSVGLWELSTGKERHSLAAHGIHSVTSVAFSPDGTRFLTGSADGTAKLWDTATGELRRTFSGDAGAVNSVAFVPDKKQILTGSYVGPARSWSVETGARLSDFSARRNEGQPPGTESSLVISSPYGFRVFAGFSGGGWARFWDATTDDGLEIDGSSVPTWNDLVAVSPDLEAVSPDGSKILTVPKRLNSKLGGGTMTTLCDATVVSNTDTGRKTLHVELSGLILAQTRNVSCVALSPDGRTFVTGNLDGTARLWDTATVQAIDEKNPLQTFSGHRDPIWCVAFSPDGSRVLTGSVDRTVKLWKTATGEDLRTFAIGSPFSVVGVILIVATGGALVGAITGWVLLKLLSLSGGTPEREGSHEGTNG